MPRILILLAAALFSTGGAAIKSSALGAWQVAGLRSVIAAAFLAIVLPRSLRGFNARAFGVGVVYAITLLLYVQSNKLTTAANAIFLQSTAPLYLLALAPWLIGEKISRKDVVLMFGLGIGLAMFFVGVEPPQTTAPDPFLGNVLGAGAGIMWALTILGLRWLSTDGGDSLGAVVAGNLLAFAIALPFWSGWPALDGRELAVIGYLGVIQIGLAYVFVIKGMKKVPAFEASLLILIEPVLNPLWAWLLHAERPSNWALAGAALILIATVANVFVRARSADGHRRNSA